jgi:hypothetical protein
MPRDLILHIGLSKTGSSSIQRVLSSQREALRSIGVYYPHSPGGASHPLLAAAVVNDRRTLWGFNQAVWEGTTPAARLERFAGEWQAELDAMPGWATRCILSTEMIGVLLRHDDEVERLAASLRPYFDPIRVVVYLRRQDLHCASAFNEWLRGGVLRGMALPQSGPADHPMLQYGALLDRFAHAFGDAAMRPRIFERARLVSGDVVEDFWHVAELDVPIPAAAPERQSNTSMTLEGQTLLLEAGKRMASLSQGNHWRETPQWRRLAESVSETLPGQGWRPTGAEAAAFMTRFAETNEHARQRFFPHQETLFATDFSDLPEQEIKPAYQSLVEAALDVVLHETAASTEREARAAMAQYTLAKRLGDTKLMRTLLMRAIKFAPDLLAPRIQFARLLLDESDTPLAAEHVAAALRIAPDDPQAARLQRRLRNERPT